jgi:hypothetical protein
MSFIIKIEENQWIQQFYSKEVHQERQ